MPERAVELAADSRTTVLLQTRTSAALGVHNVTLLLTDADGTRSGRRTGCRSGPNQVSNVIWLIIGTGVALLFGAILLRLVRRIRVAGGPPSQRGHRPGRATT